MTFKEGERVLIPCDAQPGAFSTEYLVNITMDDGVLSGFVRKEFVFVEENAPSYVEGRVVKIEPTAVVVRLPGSFFTVAAGTAELTPEWAEANLAAATA